MGNVDEGGGQLLVQLDDLGAHAGTQLCIQVGQGLVQQEDCRVTNHCTAQSNTLTLTTGQSLGLAVQQVLDLQDLGSLVNAAVDLVLRGLAQLQTESDVLVNGHVGVQSVALEHHGDITILGRNVVDQAAADVHFALGDLLQTGDHTQGGGLAAARGADEDDELLILDLQVEVGNSRSSSARIDLVDVLAANRSHRSLPPLKFFYVTAP